jgi:osmoprotectant transport system permease protein
MKDSQILISILGIASAISFDIAEVKPNRISPGIRSSAFDFMGIWVFVLLFSWVIILALSFYGKKDSKLIKAILGFMPAASIFAAMTLFPLTHHLEGSSPRISLLLGFYVQIMLSYLLISSIKWEPGEAKQLRLLLPGLFIVLLTTAAVLGYYDNYSLIKEYGIKREQFAGSLWVHFLLSVGSVAAAAIIAVPLGYLAYTRKSWEGRIMVPLGIIETIPSLSLFGLLLVPLSALGNLPLFRALGVSGIGWAPAFIALTLYALLPIARNTYSGFESVDNSIVDAASGMGLSPFELLYKVEFPLALPVVFTGIRIALVQTIGGAVLAGLVGGGGLGSFVFLGLAEASTDLVLLGVIPIVLITILVDVGLKYMEETVRSAVYD